MGIVAATPAGRVRKGAPVAGLVRARLDGGTRLVHRLILRALDLLKMPMPTVPAAGKTKPCSEGRMQKHAQAPALAMQ